MTLIKFTIRQAWWGFCFEITRSRAVICRAPQTGSRQPGVFCRSPFQRHWSVFSGLVGGLVSGLFRTQHFQLQKWRRTIFFSSSQIWSVSSFPGGGGKVSLASAPIVFTFIQNNVQVCVYSDEGWLFISARFILPRKHHTMFLTSFTCYRCLNINISPALTLTIH